MKVCTFDRVRYGVSVLVFSIPTVCLAADAVAPAGGAPENALQRWMLKLQDAGLTIPVIGLLSVLGLASILERTFRLRRSAIVPAGLSGQARALWREGRHADITAICEANPSLLARMIGFIAQNRRWPLAELSDAAGEIASRELRRHLLRAYPLAVIGALAPLLGLLGTVSGMVDAFDAVAIAGLGNVQVLGGSISKALITTLAGLVVAIPALFAYHLFRARTQYFGVALEEETAELMHEWFLPGDEPPNSPPAA